MCKNAYTLTDFTVLPSSLTVDAGEEAVFQCRHPGASISWMINSTLFIIGSSN